GRAAGRVARRSVRGGARPRGRGSWQRWAGPLARTLVGAAADALLADRRRGRTGCGRPGPRRPPRLAWPDDVAAHAGPRDAGRAALPRAIDPVGPPLSSRGAAGLNQSCWPGMPCLLAGERRPCAPACSWPVAPSTLWPPRCWPPVSTAPVPPAPELVRPKLASPSSPIPAVPNPSLRLEGCVLSFMLVLRDFH